jgi:hypothetical protein
LEDPDTVNSLPPVTEEEEEADVTAGGVFARFEVGLRCDNKRRERDLSTSVAGRSFAIVKAKFLNKAGFRKFHL